MIENIKMMLKTNINEELKIISKENRNRNEVFYGYITEMYNHVFIVSNGIESRSYSYSDILSKDILLTFN